MTSCNCTIVPADVLNRLAADKRLDARLRKAASDSARVSVQMRRLREQARELTRIAQATSTHYVELATKPKVTVYDTKHSMKLPGVPISSPKTSKDATVKRTFRQTTELAEFYRQVFGRNSIDDAGLTLMSSVHYGRDFNNAMWNGVQMIYGDGDAKLFVDFTKGSDVIGHELTHGVTQYTLQLAYEDDAGGLNESLSDCFGSMFRQWQSDQTAAQADWLIGKDILGATSKKEGYVALRNMANPGDEQCLAPQPARYSDLQPGMDPHYTSGPPNLAFCVACRNVGGRSWETIGQVWYVVMTQSGAQPNMTMKQFAARTRQVAAQLFASSPKVKNAVDSGWKQVGL
ncbi:MAG: M4 family metallopeptidase [Povalibacter sp.]